MDQASAITSFGSRAAFDAAFPGSIYETWHSFAPGTVFLNGSTVHGITYQTNSAENALVTDQFVTTTPFNGLGETGNGFLSATDSVPFTFSFAITAFGIDINTFADNDGAYTATSNLGDIALSVFDPFPDFSTGEFVGFASALPFTSVTIGALETAESYTLDTLRLVVFQPVPPPLPEPTSIALVVIGLAGLWCTRRRQSASTRVLSA